MTVEDILEEIVGDFTTSMSPTLAEEVTPQNDGSVIIDGTANVREINKAFNWHLPEDDARTVNGVILEALEEIPVAGTRVRIGEYDIDILDVQDNMIKQVKVFPVKPLRECGGVTKTALHSHAGPLIITKTEITLLLSLQLPSPHESYDHSAYNPSA